MNIKDELQQLENEINEKLTRREELFKQIEEKPKCECSDCKGCNCEDEFIVAEATLNENTRVVVIEDDFDYREVSIIDLNDGDEIVLTIEELEAIVVLSRV